MPDKLSMLEIMKLHQAGQDAFRAKIPFDPAKDQWWRRGWIDAQSLTQRC